MTFCAHHAHHTLHEGSPERWGSAPDTGGVHGGKCERGQQSLAGPTAQTLNFRQQAPRASLRPFSPTAQPTAARPTHSSPSLCWARLLEACPGVCSGKHQRSSTGRGRVKWQRQGCRGGQAPLGWAAGCWAEAQGHCRTKAHGCLLPSLCFPHQSMHTQACASRQT